jgi:hypothetical protein
VGTGLIRHVRFSAIDPRQTHPASHRVEARVGLAAGKSLVGIEVFGEQIGAFLEGLLQCGEGRLRVTQAGVDDGDVVGRNIEGLRHLAQLVERVLRLFVAWRIQRRMTKDGLGWRNSCRLCQAFARNSATVTPDCKPSRYFKRGRCRFLKLAPKLRDVSDASGHHSK